MTQVNVQPWDEKLAMESHCLTVHVFAQKADSLMYYLNCEAQNVVVTSIPKPCTCVEDAVQDATTTAESHGILLVLVDDNRVS